jgi:hypothetical protein
MNADNDSELALVRKEVNTMMGSFPLYV